jgi:hypothetical protein
MPRQTPPELYAPYHRSNELQGSGFHRAAEIQAPIPQSELEASAPPYTQAHASTHPYQPPHEAQELYAMSSEPSRSVMQRQLSSDEISALEEEERRIDAEMSEAGRMKELRDHNYTLMCRFINHHIAYKGHSSVSYKRFYTSGASPITKSQSSGLVDEVTCIEVRSEH